MIRALRPAALAFAAAVVLPLAACSNGGIGNSPPIVSSATPVPAQQAPALGAATGGRVVVSGAVVRSSAGKLTVTATLSNPGTTADELVSVGSNVSDTATVLPPLAVPAGAPVQLTAGAALLTPTGRLDPGQTVALVLGFRRAGSVQVFATYQP